MLHGLLRRLGEGLVGAYKHAGRRVEAFVDPGVVARGGGSHLCRICEPVLGRRVLVPPAKLGLGNFEINFDLFVGPLDFAAFKLAKQSFRVFVGAQRELSLPDTAFEAAAIDAEVRLHCRHLDEQLREEFLSNVHEHNDIRSFLQRAPELVLCVLDGDAGRSCLAREALRVLLAFEQLVLGGTLLLERLVLESRLLSVGLFWRSECRLAMLDLGC